MYPWKETVKAQWKIGNHEKCWKRNEALANYAKLELTTSNVLNITSDVKRFTKEINTITSSEIGNISKILENIANVDPPLDQSTVNSDFVMDFYNIINNVLNVNETILINSQKESDSSNSIIKAVKNFTEKWVFSEEGQSRNISLPNIAVSVANVSSGEANNVTAYADDEYFQISSQPNQIQSTNASLVITLSKEVFNQDTRKTFKVLFILYRKTLFFKATDQLEGWAKIRGFVIAASAREKPIENLDKAVVIRHSISAGEKAISKKLCVFWDFEAKQHRGDWSTAGCKLTSDGNYDECHCNHLTNFALLLDFEPDKTSKHKETMSIISYIGCSLSLLGIALTLCTMIYFRELLASKASKIFFFVCVTLGAALIVFVAAAERRKTATNAACIATGIMIHHLVISSLAWMIFEALTLYYALVKVLPKAALEEKLPSLKICCLVCWGIPGIIVSITAGVTYDSYSNKEYCFLQGLPMVVAFFVPVAFFLVVNTIACILIFYRLLTSGPKVRSTHRTSSIEKARRGLAISVFLGLTWISGVLPIRDAKVVFQYVFCIVNSLQGLLIFLFYCVFSTEVRKKIRTLCCGQPPLPAGRGGPVARMEMRAMRPAFEEVPGGINDIAAAGNVAEENDV